MKKPNITPGPWSILDAYDAILTNDGRQETIWEITNREEGNTPAYATSEAEAQFIAAAPQLAEALHDIAAAFETLWRITCKDHPNETLEAAKSALIAAGYTE